MVLKGVMFLAISLWQNCEKRQHFIHSWKIAQADKNNNFHYLAFTILRNQTNYMESLIHLHHTNMVRCSASSPKRGNYNISRYEHIYVLRISCTWRPQRLFTFAMVPSNDPWKPCQKHCMRICGWELSITSFRYFWIGQSFW